MAFMKFYVGNEANASSHRDGIYIAIDTKKIFYNGDVYGGSEVDLSNYATKADLNKYLPLSGGILTGNLYVNGRDTSGNFGISLTRLSIGVNTPLSMSSSDPYYHYSSQLDNHSLIISSQTNKEMVLDKNGIRIRNKTNQYLLHAAGGTISIDELKSQLNIPDTSALQDAIGTNVYTGANYISKETNLTDAVLQLDTEIKATNDNLTLEHENAEATYAKKTELGKKLDISTYTSDKATFALKSEIPDVSNFLTISNAQSTYLTKTDARNTYQPKGNYLTAIPSEYVTDSELNAKGYQTEAQVAAKVASLVDSAPETLDTLNELAAALGDDPNFATTVTNQIASKQDKLVSGTNIKTINGQTLLGSGDITTPTPTVNAASGTKTIWTGTSSEYEAVSPKDANTLYFITEE